MDAFDLIGHLTRVVRAHRRDRFWMNAWHYQFAEQAVEAWEQLRGDRP